MLLYKTAVLKVKMANHYRNHRFHIEMNVPIAFILPSRWKDGAKSLRIEATSCFWRNVRVTKIYLSHYSMPLAEDRIFAVTLRRLLLKL